MSVATQAAAFAVSIAAGAGASLAEPVKVDVASHGVWTTEIVTRTDVERVACAAFTGPETGPGVFLSLANAGEAGEISALIFRERGERPEDTMIGGDGYGERSGVAFVFSNGAVFLAKDSLRGSDDQGVFAEAYPNPETAPDIIDALRASNEVTLMRGEVSLHAVPLEGFAEAYAAIAKACAFEARVAG